MDIKNSTKLSSPFKGEQRSSVEVMSDKNLVHLKGVTFHWGSDEPPVLSIEELCIPKGEHVFIHGDSGSGKTTLLNLLCGIHKPSSGRIEILGQEINKLSNQERDRFRGDHLGVIFQQFNLLPFLSVKENISLPLGFSKKRQSATSNLDEEVSHLLNALDLPTSLSDKKVAELSVGQQQRVAACRALLGSPELVIADEPTSALDNKNRDKFLQLLFKEADKNDSTIIFVSHDENIAKNFSHTIELSDISQQASKHTQQQHQ